MSTSAMTPMISPDGDVGDVPQEKVEQAVKSGFKIGVELQTDEGEQGVVPMDQAHDAISSGKFHIPPPKVPRPSVNPQYVDLIAGKTAKSQTGGANPGASQDGLPGFEGNIGDEGKQNATSIAGGAAALGLGAAAIPAVLPHTIEGVKALGKWAAKNPVQAYILYQVMKELIPGAKKTMGIIKEAPTP